MTRVKAGVREILSYRLPKRKDSLLMTDDVHRGGCLEKCRLAWRRRGETLTRMRTAFGPGGGGGEGGVPASGKKKSEQKVKKRAHRRS